MEERLLGYERVMHYVIVLQAAPMTKPRLSTLRMISGSIRSALGMHQHLFNEAIELFVSWKALARRQHSSPLVMEEILLVT